MFEKKQSWWKRNGFYLASCVLLIGAMAAGVIFSQNNQKNNSDKMLADIATEVPKNEVYEANANITPKPTTTPTVKPAKKVKIKPSKKPVEKKTKAVMAKPVEKLSFKEDSGLAWPVTGKVIQKYSMNKMVFMKTLEQYKFFPGIMIAGNKGDKVKAAARGEITEIKKDDELGNTVSMKIGNNYTLSYGQLDDISVKKGEMVKEGQVIGKIAEPTKYYSEEGKHLYFQVKEGKNTVDPLLLLR